MAYTVTHVQMTDREQINPELLKRISAPYDWNGSRHSAAEWETWLAEQLSRRCSVLMFEGEHAGVIAYEPYPGDESGCALVGESRPRSARPSAARLFDFR